MPPKSKTKSAGQPMYKKRVSKPCCDAMYFSSDRDCKRSKPEPWHKDDPENVVNINTNISVNQSNVAEANGGNGGSGGSAAAGSASSIATGEGDSSTDLRVNSETETNGTQKVPGDNASPAAAADETGAAEQDKVNPLQDVAAVATESTATGGAGGAGGAGGGVTATQSNDSSITVENCNVVIVASKDVDLYPPTTVSVGGSRQLDIKVNEKGEAFVNGQKMEERTVPGGTTVYVYHDSQNTSQVQEGEAGEV